MLVENDGTDYLMARAEETLAKQNARTGQSLENQYNATSQSELGGLLPAYSTEAAHPMGFAPNDLAGMNTAAQQSEGGSMAGAVGQGNLEAARNRNSGSFAPALDSAATGAGKTLSQDALGVNEQNAQLKEQQRQQGLQGMLGLYDTSTAAGMNALGESNNAVNAGTGAAQQTTGEWMPFLQQAAANLTKPTGGG